jgi:hypothetical protein
MTIHFLLRFGAPLTLLLAACIGIIHAQPYDASELRAFLTPQEGCPMPCFMGIRPGVTSLEEAGIILTRHSWVQDVRQFYNSRTGEITMIQWTWNGSQPGLIDSTVPAYVYGSSSHIILSLNIETTIPFGDLWLGLGKPDRGMLQRAGGFMGVLVQNVGYFNGSFGARSEFLCPVQRYQVYQTAVSISFVTDVVSLVGDEDYTLSNWAHVRRCLVD